MVISSVMAPSAKIKKRQFSTVSNLSMVPKSASLLVFPVVFVRVFRRLSLSLSGVFPRSFFLSLLVRTFVITFLNSEINTNHAQLIFTSHDSWQLNGNMLRRDEIWFTEKDTDGVSTLYSLADFVDEDGTKIRKDENYERNYLLGKYGAIPSLKYFDMFKEE